jgi:hypothetical protein
MQIDAAIREPTVAEAQRAIHLFRQARLRPEARFLVAVRSRPVERFVAAVAWWPENVISRFMIAFQPGVDRAPIAPPLLDRLTDVCRAAGMQSLESADLLDDHAEQSEMLRAQGFERIRSERFFEVPGPDLRLRTTRLYEKYKTRIPPAWHTEPIRHHAPEPVLNLIAPHCLMPPAEVRGYWRAEPPVGFDPELSCLLFDGNRLFGALLMRRIRDLMYVDVQVVHEPNPRLRSLADLCLVYHPVQRVPLDSTISRIQFRSGEKEHVQTANLALRMGGRELFRRHVLGRRLTS